MKQCLTLQSHSQYFHILIYFRFGQALLHRKIFSHKDTQFVGEKGKNAQITLFNKPLGPKSILGAIDPVDSSSCSSVTSRISTCTDSLPTGGDVNKFNFAFWTCSTPRVSGIDVNNGTVQTTISIFGEGFSTVECQNEVRFGINACDVSFCSETLVTCTFAKTAEPELGVLHPIAVRVGNRGDALVAIMSEHDSGFGMIPNIETIKPTFGSLAGGSRITLQGFGFGDSPLVFIGSATCNILESTYTEIICESPASTAGEKDVQVLAYINAMPLTAECETLTRTCRYTYADIWTPSVTSIEPDSMSGSTTFTITGTAFGSTPSELLVTIGGETATVLSADDTRLTAEIDNIPAGDNEVIVKEKTFGKASGSLKVYGSPTVSIITPSSGSIYGETAITIQGNGFVENDTTVTIDGASCEILKTLLSEVTCKTQSHVAATVSVEITSNGVSYASNSYSYSLSSTPTITSISPTSGFAGDILTIAGANLNGGVVTVTLGDADCSVLSYSSTEIQCTLGKHSTGSVPVSVHIPGLGVSNTNQEYEYQLSITSILPNEGEKI